jgi:UDPglucose 6-dehydrogenase
MGFVGNACIQGFETLVTSYKLKSVNSFDIDLSKNPTHTDLASFVKNSDIIFVCVPSPMRLSDGHCDTSIVEKVVGQIAELSKNKVVVIKSTVPPGTTDSLAEKFNIRLVFNPEFLTEANWLQDFMTQERVVLGGPITETDLLTDLYASLVPDSAILLMTPKEAELVKYASNCFLATKVAYFNELWQICQASGADYENVRRAVAFDSRIGKSHTKVPGPDGHFGFGGTCFPKDLSAFIHYTVEHTDVAPDILVAVWNKNLDVRPEADWETMYGRAVSTE